MPCHIRTREASKLVVVVRKLRAPFCNAYLGLCSACVHPGVDWTGFEALVMCRGVIALMPIPGVLRAERHLVASGCTCAVREVQKVPNLTFAVFFALANEFVILLLTSSVRSRGKNVGHQSIARRAATHRVRQSFEVGTQSGRKSERCRITLLPHRRCASPHSRGTPPH